MVTSRGQHTVVLTAGRVGGGGGGGAIKLCVASNRLALFVVAVLRTLRENFTRARLRQRDVSVLPV